MQTKYLIAEKLSKYFSDYSIIDFGIGIDFGDVYIVRAGIPRNANNNDLVFIGKSVNFATAISNQTKSPNHIGISEEIYNSLEDTCKYGKNEYGQRADIWDSGYVQMERPII